MEKKLCIAGLICLATVLGCEKRRDAATDLEAPAFSGNAVEETKMADVKEKRRPSHADFQRVVAQNYFAHVQKNAKTQPADEMVYQVNLGLQAMENSLAYGNDQAGAGMQPLIQETRQLVQDPKLVNRDQIAAQLQKLTTALKQ
jgi:hypothetical protein